MKARASEDILEALWKAYQARVYQERQGVRISKRTFSSHFLRANRPAHASTLAQWTKPKDKQTWKIPLSRIPETVSMLGGTQRDEDELMQARLLELSQSHPQSDVMVLAKWLLGHMAKPLLPDEQWLVQTYRDNMVGPDALFQGARCTPQNQETMLQALKACQDREEAQRLDELRLEEGQGSGPLDAAQIERVRQRITQAQRQARERAEQEAKAQANRLKKEHARVLQSRGITAQALENSVAKKELDAYREKQSFKKMLKNLFSD